MHIDQHKAELAARIAKQRGYTILDINATMPNGVKIKGEPLVLIAPGGTEVRRSFSEAALFMRKDHNCEACWLYDMNAAVGLLEELSGALCLDRLSGQWQVVRGVFGEVFVTPSIKIKNVGKLNQSVMIMGENEEPEVAIATAWLRWQELEEQKAQRTT